MLKYGGWNEVYTCRVVEEALERVFVYRNVAICVSSYKKRTREVYIRRCQYFILFLVFLSIDV